MASTYLIADSIISAMGMGTELHWDKFGEGKSGIGLINREDITLKNFYGASISGEVWDSVKNEVGNTALSRLEALAVAAINRVVLKCPIPLSSPNTGFVISSTKGNIDLIQSKEHRGRLPLPQTAQTIASYFQNPNQPFVVSNACISGISAILFADTLLKNHQFQQVVVVGVDLLSEFTVSGFNCLHAVSPFPCTPFDEGRAGLSPGEGCGVLVLSTVPVEKRIRLIAGASSNDANHISGPSRTGDGLALAIKKAMKSGRVSATQIDYVCTHGTATVYNDESESQALALASVNHVSSNSLKGFFGHTFGAAGVIETILTAHAMDKSQLLPSFGLKKVGVSTQMNLLTQKVEKPIAFALKTASGFGGCNAALILGQE